ncbi:polA [Symbiodinium natans]|uniref:PolA protein n=1 Tax=Symbiodinium natans TaxID=878477 RepID=A0A812JX39_9DINO|nr:polA [Symbiodinium natans]
MASLGRGPWEWRVPAVHEAPTRPHGRHSRLLARVSMRVSRQFSGTPPNALVAFHVLPAAGATTALSAAKVLRRRRATRGTCSKAVMTLVDGHYHLYKSFHATAGAQLCNQRGEPTNVVYTFMQQLERIHRELEPSHMAVVLDSQTSALSRRQVLPEYKKNRRCPPDLLVQVPKVMQACEAMGVPWRAHEDFEADDLIASYTRRFVECGEEGVVKILSCDKDLLELVSDKVELVDTRDQHSPFQRMDVAQAGTKTIGATLERAGCVTVRVCSLVLLLQWATRPTTSRAPGAQNHSENHSIHWQQIDIETDFMFEQTCCTCPIYDLTLREF